MIPTCGNSNIWTQPLGTVTLAKVESLLVKPSGGTMNELLQRISIDPNVCFGKPCVRGTRIWVSLLLDLLASGMSEREILNEYPQLQHEDILAAIGYGAEAARERIIPVPLDSVA